MEIPTIETIGIYTVGASVLAMTVAWIYGMFTRERTRVTKQDLEDAEERADLRQRVNTQEERIYALAQQLAESEKRGAVCEERSAGQARDIERLTIETARQAVELRTIQERNAARDAELSGRHTD